VAISTRGAMEFWLSVSDNKRPSNVVNRWNEFGTDAVVRVDPSAWLIDLRISVTFNNEFLS